jgi:ABC-type antimicrobial peptide transport system permease subunit
MTPRFARLSYGSALSLKEREFIQAAWSVGAGGTRIVRRYILPNILGEILVMSSLWIATAIRVESNLSFLGLGIPPPYKGRFFDKVTWLPSLRHTVGRFETHTAKEGNHVLSARV